MFPEILDIRNVKTVTNYAKSLFAIIIIKERHAFLCFLVISVKSLT